MRTCLVAAVGAAAVTLAAVGAAKLTTHDEPRASSTTSSMAATPPATAADAWRKGVLEDFEPLAAAAFVAVRSIGDWNAGRVVADEVKTPVIAALIASQDTQHALSVRAPLAGTEQSLELYRAAASLYHESLRTILLATALPAGPLQQQVRSAGARDRDLGDRVFDQAGVTLAPLLPPEQAFADIELRRPPDVPDYAALGLGVGPPLDSTPITPRPARTFQQTRPEQSVQKWWAAVRQLTIPTTVQLAALIAASAPSELAATARELMSDADALRDLPDPRGGRSTSTQLQLALVTHAEALRAAQAAALLSGAPRQQLLAVAGALADIAGRLRPVEQSARRAP